VKTAGYVEADQRTKISETVGNTAAAGIFLQTAAIAAAVTREQKLKSMDQQQSLFSPEKNDTPEIPAHAPPPTVLHVAMPTVTHELFSDQEKTPEEHAQHEALRRERKEKREEDIKTREQTKQKTAVANKSLGEALAKKFGLTRDDEPPEVTDTDVTDIVKATTILHNEFMQSQEPTNVHPHTAPTNSTEEGKNQPKPRPKCERTTAVMKKK